MRTAAVAPLVAFSAAVAPLAAFPAAATSICVMSAKRTFPLVQPYKFTCAHTRATGLSSALCAAKLSLPRET